MIDKEWMTIAAAVAIGIVNAAVAVTVLPIVLGIDFGGQFFWYAARAAGLVAYLLATGSVLFGIATSTRLGTRLLGKGNVADVHRSLSLLTLLAIAAHLLFLAQDQYASFGADELFIPFVAWYRPVWTGLGIIAAYLAAAVYISFYIRPMIGYKAWRSFHYAAFGVFGLGTLHGLLAGSDSGAPWALGIYGISTLAVAVMLAYRISMARRQETPALRTWSAPADGPYREFIGSNGR